MNATAVFLDRDGTIIDDPGYVRDPDQVRLLPGAAEAIRRFAGAGHLVVVISNQSGIARGLFDQDALDAVHARLEALLRADGADLDGAYYCPYLDSEDATVDTYRRDSDLRKPNPGMLLQAARELNIDLARSWMIGDSARDVEAGRRAGCRTILLQGDRSDERRGAARPTHTVSSLAEVAEIVEQDMDNNDDAEDGKSGNRNDDAIVGILSEVRDLLERTHRGRRQQDFSILRLFGALLQMVAVVAAIWGIAAVLGDRHGAATARLTLACFLQLASVTAFAIDRFR